jgi:antitoxin ParD1/3/4
MNVSISVQLEEWIHEKVKSGYYQTASEVIREALRLLKDKEQIREIKIKELRKRIALGIEDLEAGRMRTLDERVLDEVKASGRKKGLSK